MNVVQDQKVMGDLAAQVNSAVQNQIANSPTIAQQMQDATKLNQAITNAGSIAEIAKSALSAIQTVLTPNSQMTQDNITKITNSVETKFNVTNITQNDISNIIENVIKTNITSSNISSCNAVSNAINTLTIKDATVNGTNNKLNLCQTTFVEVLNSCIIGTVQSGLVQNKLLNTTSTEAKTQVSNEASIQQTTENKTDVDQSVVNKSAIEDTITSAFGFLTLGFLGPFIILGIVIILIVIIVLIFRSIFSSSNNGSGDTTSDVASSSNGINESSEFFKNGLSESSISVEQ
jgi:hypothetical protein